MSAEKKTDKSVPMDVPVDISWGEKGEGKREIKDSFPLRFPSFTFTNPTKKRKAKSIGDEKFLIVRKDKDVADKKDTDKKDAVEKKEGAVSAKRTEGLVARLSSLNLLLSSYLSLALNLFLLLLFVTSVLKFAFAVKNDIHMKSLKKIKEGQMDVEECRRQYVLNKCNPEDRVPALEQQCAEWERCMNRDPFRIEVTSVIFRVVSDSLEQLFSGFSMRSLAIGAFFAVLFMRVLR